MSVVVAIDAGTTGIRALAVDESATVVSIAYRELTQRFPRPGLVEHDAAEIWRLVEATLAELAAELEAQSQAVAAIGITNQRETAVAWDKKTGLPLHPSIVWQDRRTAGRCADLEAAGHLPLIRAATGLVLDSYFSASKWEWMLTEGGVKVTDTLALGTVDDWVVWNLTGGPRGGVHATDPSNASRTMLYDLRSKDWSDELTELFAIPRSALGEIRPSSGRVGHVAAAAAGGRLSGVPVSGIAGDQQAALFGQCCHEVGMAKVTYGTGSFVLTNVGQNVPSPPDGLLATVAWEIGDRTSFALEGAIFVSGAAVQWLRDGLGILEHASQTEPLASRIGSNEGVYLVPAFAGLGSPWWDPGARGAIFGISKGTGRPHLARAAVEAIAYQTRDVLAAMENAAGEEISVLRADGGAAAMDLLLQLQADQCRIPVTRPATTEVTALGACFLAGLAEGVWAPGDLAGLVPGEKTFEPATSKARADQEHAIWLRALEHTRSRPGSRP